MRIIERKEVHKEELKPINVVCDVCGSTLEVEHTDVKIMPSQDDCGYNFVPEYQFFICPACNTKNTLKEDKQFNMELLKLVRRNG